MLFLCDNLRNQAVFNAAGAEIFDDQQCELTAIVQWNLIK